MCAESTKRAPALVGVNDADAESSIAHKTIDARYCSLPLGITGEVVKVIEIVRVDGCGRIFRLRGGDEPEVAVRLDVLPRRSGLERDNYFLVSVAAKCSRSCREATRLRLLKLIEWDLERG